MNIYAAGHCLTRGSQMQRQAEREELDAVASDLDWYMPQDNAEINDKAKANPEGLAERIVKHDTDALFWSDVVVIEPLPEALGTHVELGQLKGMRDVALQVLSIIDSSEGRTEALLSIVKEMGRHVNRVVYPHYEDIRRPAGITESEDRRSLGINQYVYGACLELTDGKGFYGWNEVKKELNNAD